MVEKTIKEVKKKKKGKKQSLIKKDRTISDKRFFFFWWNFAKMQKKIKIKEYSFTDSFLKN